MNFVSSNIPILVALVAFLAIFLFLYGVVQSFRQRGRRKDIVDRIRRSGEGAGLHYKSAIPDTKSSRKRVTNVLSALGQRAVPTQESDYSKLRIKFLRAGIRTENFAPTFWGVKILLAFFLPVVFLFLRFSFFQLMTARLTLIFCILAAVFGYYLPDLILYLKTSSRKDKLHKSLPDALDLMVVCVEAGMGLDAAINRVAQEIKTAWPDLSHEFNTLNLELRAGKARKDALRDLALRTDIAAVNSLVTLLLQTDKFGTSVSSALKVFSEGFRQERFQRAEEQAAKLPVKLVFPLILFIFPALFVVVAAPAFIKIWQNIINR